MGEVSKILEGVRLPAGAGRQAHNKGGLVVMARSRMSRKRTLVAVGSHFYGRFLLVFSFLTLCLRPAHSPLLVFFTNKPTHLENRRWEYQKRRGKLCSYCSRITLVK